MKQSQAIKTTKKGFEQQNSSSEAIVPLLGYR